jgi:hypothetical protein
MTGPARPAAAPAGPQTRAGPGCDHDLMAITYRTGDATAPGSGEPDVIAHVCNDSGGLLAVIATMREDFAATGAGEWENADLGRFLDGLAGFLADLDGYFARRGQQVPDQPSWGLLAATLIAATGYE